MAEERNPDRYARLVDELRWKNTLAVSAAVVSFHIVVFLSVWLLKDMVRPGNVAIVLVPVILFGEAAFCVYTAILFIASDPLPTTKLKTRLLWWHGCGVIFLMGLAIAGALVNFVFVSAFSGLVSETGLLRRVIIRGM